VLVKGIGRGTVQGDIQFLRVLEDLGCEVKDTADGISVEAPPSRHFPGLEVDMNDFSDQFMTLAVLGTFASSPMVITNIAHVKHQESNRLAACLTELRRLGIECHERDDGLVVHPGEPKPGDVETYDDHRIAMSFALLGLRYPGIRIVNPGCVSKTFPEFFETLESIVP